MGCGNSPKSKFLKTLNKIQDLKTVNIENIILEKQPFDDLIQGIITNKNLESFTIHDVNILGKV